MASSAGRHADARVPIPYAVGKAAVVQLTQNTAIQAGADGIETALERAREAGGDRDVRTASAIAWL